MDTLMHIVGSLNKHYGAVGEKTFRTFMEEYDATIELNDITQKYNIMFRDNKQFTKTEFFSELEKIIFKKENFSFTLTIHSFKKYEKFLQFVEQKIANLVKVAQQPKELKTKEKKAVSKKNPISKTLRRLVWNSHIGESIGKANCLCCGITSITQLNFECGHIVSESNGGNTHVSNLKPICSSCNKSMGKTNMDEFMKAFTITSN
jgi:hypothetical protein